MTALTRELDTKKKKKKIAYDEWNGDQGRDVRCW